MFLLSVSAQRDRRGGVVFPESYLAEQRLPKLYPLPAFELIDASGEPFTQESLAGRFWVADFIFTTCAGPCPVMSSRMADLAEAFADNPAVQFLSISVNPETDTPEVLREYADRYQADTSRWHFVTGDRNVIHSLAVEGFKLGSVDEPIMHSTRFVLVDDEGYVRGYYESSEPEGSLELTRDLTSLLP
jgi:protein SCO1/2